MKFFFSVFIVLGLVLGFACSENPPVVEPLKEDSLQPTPYLYKPPVTAQAGLPTAKLKKEDLAEAFVSRLSTKQAAGIVVLQQEKLVLEEYFNMDSTALVCTDALFPAYSGALLARMYRDKFEVPYQPIPLQQLYPEQDIPMPGPLRFRATRDTASTKQQAALFNTLIQQNMPISQGLAAEELLFEPLQIDDYQWRGEALCLHPHAMLQLGSLWVRRGRWNNEQLLPDQFIQTTLAPAYDNSSAAESSAFGWQYYRLLAKGRKHPVMYYKGQDFALFLLPEIEAVALLQGPEAHMPEAWSWMQNYLIPSLMP